MNSVTGAKLLDYLIKKVLTTIKMNVVLQDNKGCRDLVRHSILKKQIEKYMN